MKVQQVKIKRFKKLEDFQKNFDGHNVIICGKNELGKSSVLQFIGIALGDQTNIPPRATGEGEIITTKDGKQFTFQVKFKDGKPQVTIISPDGLKDSRKGTLEQICGAMGFNIGKFVEQSKTKSGRKEQIETIKGFLPESTRIDLAKYEADVAAKYEERTNLSKDLKNIDGSIKTHPLFNHTEKELRSFAKIEVGDVFSQLQEAETHNKKRADVLSRKDSRTAEIEADQEQIRSLEEKIKVLRAGIEEKAKQNTQANDWLSANTEIDTTPLKEKIANSQKTNEDYNRAQELIGLYEKKAVLENSVGELSVQIEQGREMISEAIKECSTIIDGLSFDDDSLLLDGIPVDPASLSTSQIMRLGYRLHVLKNPESPIFLEGLESFDSDKMKELLEFANAEGVQVIGEKVEADTKEIRFELIPVE